MLFKWGFRVIVFHENDPTDQWSDVIYVIVWLWAKNWWRGHHHLFSGVRNPLWQKKRLQQVFKTLVSLFNKKILSEMAVRFLQFQHNFNNFWVKNRWHVNDSVFYVQNFEKHWSKFRSISFLFSSLLDWPKEKLSPYRRVHTANIDNHSSLLKKANCQREYLSRYWKKRKKNKNPYWNMILDKKT